MSVGGNIFPCGDRRQLATEQLLADFKIERSHKDFISLNSRTKILSHSWDCARFGSKTVAKRNIG